MPIGVTFQSRYSTFKLAQPAKHLNVFALYVLVQDVKPAGQVIDSCCQTN